MGCNACIHPQERVRCFLALDLNPCPTNAPGSPRIRSGPYLDVSSGWDVSIPARSLGVKPNFPPIVRIVSAQSRMIRHNGLLTVVSLTLPFVV